MSIDWELLALFGLAVAAILLAIVYYDVRAEDRQHDLIAFTDEVIPTGKPTPAGVIEPDRDERIAADHAVTDRMRQVIQP